MEDHTPKILYGHNKRTIEIEPDIWEQLTNWSNQECRTIGGQIKYLVKHYSPPQLKTQESSAPLQLEILRNVTPSSKEDGWEYTPWRQRRIKPDTQRMSILEIFLEYNEPLSNTDLLLLFQAKFPATRHSNIDALSKQTSNMYHCGLLKRRENLSKHTFDVYQYIIHPRSINLVKIARTKSESR
jgi:hypothetical protein